MSENSNQRTSRNEVTDGPEQGGDDGGALADRRAETDRLFAVAEKSFAAMTQSNSREFLKRSRQTGGQ